MASASVQHTHAQQTYVSITNPSTRKYYRELIFKQACCHCKIHIAAVQTLAWAGMPTCPRTLFQTTSATPRDPKLFVLAGDWLRRRLCISFVGRWVEGVWECPWRKIWNTSKRRDVQKRYVRWFIMLSMTSPVASPPGQHGYCYTLRPRVTSDPYPALTPPRVCRVILYLKGGLSVYQSVSSS